MDSKQITLWLSESNLPCEQLSSNRWKIALKHKYCDYVVTVTDHGSWFSFAADLIGDVSGTQQEKFYKYILALNARLNGVSVALEEDRFVLIRDEYSEDMSLNKYNLYRSLKYFHEAHQGVYIRILQTAKSLGVVLHR